MLSHKAKRPFKQYTEGGYSTWQVLQRHLCTGGGKLSHKEDEWKEAGRHPSQWGNSLQRVWTAWEAACSIFYLSELISLFLLIPSQPLILNIVVYMVVQLSMLEEFPFKCSKQLHFQKCLPSSPFTEGSWVSALELGSPAQYSANTDCLKCPHCGCPADPLFLLPS